MGKPKAPQYPRIPKTDWTRQGEEIATQVAYPNMKDMLPRMNIMNQSTLSDIDNTIGNMYNRAEGDFERNYRNTMANTLARDYNRFGSTGATPSLYARDMQNMQQQRKLADFAYNKAMNRENLIDNELQRRGDAYNRYASLFSLGAAGQELENKNNEIDRMNTQIDYQNKMQKYAQRQQLMQAALMAGTAGIGALGGAGTILGNLGKLGTVLKAGTGILGGFGGGAQGTYNA